MYSNIAYVKITLIDLFWLYNFILIEILITVHLNIA